MSDKSKIAKVSSAVMTTATAIRFYTEYKQKWDSKRTHSIEIEESSYVFESLMTWLQQNVPTSKHMKLVSKSWSNKVIHNPAKGVSFDLNGYEIRMSIPDDRPKMETNDYGELDVAKRSVTFSCRHKEGIDALVALCDDIWKEKKSKQREPIFSNVSTGNGWGSRYLPNRYIDAVFLKNGDKEKLIYDIDYFLAHEEDYAKIGAPWHRGYLLYGPPGNGKTSLVQAIAHKYQRNLYQLSLSTVKNDANLAERVNQIERNSFLLLEDLDIFKDSVKRDSNKSDSPTLAGLLNTFDGVNTPHGLITFLTTNVVDTLDPALIRPGRMDLHLELTAPDEYQITNMFRSIYGEDLDVEHKEFDSMAAFADILKRHIGDAEGARLEIKRAE